MLFTKLNKLWGEWSHLKYSASYSAVLIFLWHITYTTLGKLFKCCVHPYVQVTHTRHLRRSSFILQSTFFESSVENTIGKVLFILATLLLHYSSLGWILLTVGHRHQRIEERISCWTFPTHFEYTVAAEASYTSFPLLHMLYKSQWETETTFCNYYLHYFASVPNQTQSSAFCSENKEGVMKREDWRQFRLWHR